MKVCLLLYAVKSEVTSTYYDQHTLSAQSPDKVAFPDIQKSVIFITAFCLNNTYI